MSGLDLNMAVVELSGITLSGPLVAPVPRTDDRSAPGTTVPAASWSLGPLATAEGAIRAEIVDAHLVFDADVTVPIRQGRIHFNDATVEHVGPDSRMGVSRMGIYVDAPNGRSYLYQFPATPVSGVQYEQRGALLGARVSDRGSLELQPFAEALLGQLGGGHGLGVTEQARLLFDRTAVKGEVRLADGQLALPGVQADMVGRAKGHNTVRVHSESVGRGLTVEVDSLSARNAQIHAGDVRFHCDEITAALGLRLFIEGTQLRFTMEIAKLRLSGLRKMA
ncbi:hypothetical protein WG902_05545 [Ramlibacter sp. PS3R-8]|uniref:hypothetical protein n=1 Tax=Ramlibacter sp. PS3R-8 TaxID=3133437 RepID=UPI0030A22ADD